MSAKRKDNKGRVLKKGESQRKDLTYQYRYQDITGKRRTVYAPTLDELRKKEAQINGAVNDGLNYNEGGITVNELLERYISLKQGVRNATQTGYKFVKNLVKKEDFGYRKIRDIKMSDAKLWLMKLQQDGRGYSTITSVRGIVKPAFQMAYEEDIIKKNPFDFKLSDVVKNDSKAGTQNRLHALCGKDEDGKWLPLYSYEPQCGTGLKEHSGQPSSAAKRMDRRWVYGVSAFGQE